MSKRKPLFQDGGQVEQLSFPDHTDLGGILSLGKRRLQGADNTITFKGSNMLLLNNGGGTQNVDEITGGEDGDILILRLANNASNVRVRNGQGNIKLQQNRMLNSDTDVLMLMNVNDTTWIELNWRS